MNLAFLSPLLRLFEPFTHLDPAGWVAVQSKIPFPIAIIMFGAGLVLAFRGARWLFRLAVAPVAFVGGLIAGPLLAPLVHMKPSVAQPLAAVAFTVAGLAYPPILLFCALGYPGGLLAADFAGPADYWLGFIPGFLVAGALSLVLERVLRVFISSVVAGAFMALGGLAIATFTQFGAVMASTPNIPLMFAGFVMLASLVFQFHATRPEEVAAEERQQKQRDKLLEQEDKERIKRYEQQAKKMRQR